MKEVFISLVVTLFYCCYKKITSKIFFNNNKREILYKRNFSLYNFKKWNELNVRYKNYLFGLERFMALVIEITDDDYKKEEYE